MRISKSVFVSVTGLLLAGSASAQTGTAAASVTPSVAVAADDKGAGSQVQVLQTAADLAAYGRRARDPYALIAAARMELGVGPSAAAFKPGAAERLPDATAAAPGSKPQHAGDHKGHATGFLNEAKTLARGDKTVLAAIDSTLSQASKGATCGCKQGLYRLEAQSRQSFGISFVGGEPAEVLIVGDGDTDLDVYVYDVMGQLVAKDTKASSNGYVRWKPYETQQYSIRVVNLGNVWSAYRLTTN